MQPHCQMLAGPSAHLSALCLSPATSDLLPKRAPCFSLSCSPTVLPPKAPRTHSAPLFRLPQPPLWAVPIEKGLAELVLAERMKSDFLTGLIGADISSSLSAFWKCKAFQPKIKPPHSFNLKHYHKHWSDLSYQDKSLKHYLQRKNF